MQGIEIPKLLSIGEVGARCGLNRDMAAYWITRLNILPLTKVGGRRAFTADAVRLIIEAIESKSGRTNQLGVPNQ